jgi:hypothetical protein
MRSSALSLFSNSGETGLRIMAKTEKRATADGAEMTPTAVHHLGGGLALFKAVKDFVISTFLKYV